jgi:predicted nucleotidyltransferase
LVTCRTEGKQRYYQANADCPVFAELQGLVLKTAGLADVLGELLAPLEDRIDHAFIYGSQANGTASASSDVDVMIVGDVSLAEIVSALAAAQEKLGREVNPTVYPASEFSEKLRKGQRFLKTVMSGPRIFLIGDEDELG